MAAAKKENAQETYLILKEEDLSLKALLNIVQDMAFSKNRAFHILYYVFPSINFSWKFLPILQYPKFMKRKYKSGEFLKEKNDEKKSRKPLIS